jgi:predicted DCC family thiol-disulfide oxidoreductase YuxK
MKKWNLFIDKLFNKKIDGNGLAVFRIVYSAILLCEISQLYYFRQLIFDKVPFIDRSEIDFAIPIALWFISVLFVLFGAFTRFFSILNYVLGLIVVGSIHAFEYHVFYAYMGVNFLFMFMPISQCLSLDRLFIKLKYSNTTFQYNPSKEVRQFYYFVVPFLGLGIVYLDSIFYKVVTPMWYNGLGSWLPSSIPMMTHTNTSTLLNQEWLIKAIGWLTIVFELLFTFVFFKKKWRIGVLIGGLILHFGIFIEFPIPWFALIGCSIYILIVPVSFWKSIFTRKDNGLPTLTLFYDSECPLCVRTKIAVSHFNSLNRISFKTVQLDAQDSIELKGVDKDLLLNDIYSVDSKGKVYNGIDTYIQILSRIWYFIPFSLLLRLPGIYSITKRIYSYVAKNRTSVRCTDDNCGYNVPVFSNPDNLKILQNVTLFDIKRISWKYFLGFAILIQAMLITHSWSFEKMREGLNIKNSSLDIYYMNVTNGIGKLTKTFLGLTEHQVFTDRIHFDNYNHIVSVIYVDRNGHEKWLPIIDKNGQPDLYIYGSNWVNWTFRVNGMTVNQNILSEGVKRYTAFWAKKNKVNLKDAKFLIKVKKVVAPKKWEKDFLNKQIAKPWIDGGYVEWKDNKFTSNIKNIESL